MTKTALNPTQRAFMKKMSNPLMLRFYLFFKIPLGFFAGMKIIHLDQNKAISTIPFKWLNKNPFKSMYFGVQGMAAELATGVIALTAIQGHEVSIAGIVTGSDAEFIKQARGKIFFTCKEGQALFEAVEKCKTSDQGESIKVKSEGRLADGTIVSVFHIHWSFKKRKKP